MGHKAGTTDGAQGWDDGWGARPGQWVLAHGLINQMRMKDEVGYKPVNRGIKKRNMKFLIFRFWGF